MLGETSGRLNPGTPQHLEIEDGSVVGRSYGDGASPAPETAPGPGDG